MKLDPDTLKVVIAQIDRGIEEAQNKIERLKKAKAELLSGGLGESSSSVSRTPSGRLPRGMPLVIVKEAFDEKSKLFIRDIMAFAEEKHKIDLADASIRRALNKLVKQGKITQQDDGSWFWLEEKTEKSVNSVVDKDDDFPF